VTIACHARDFEDGERRSRPRVHEFPLGSPQEPVVVDHRHLVLGLTGLSSAQEALYYIAYFITRPQLQRW